ncbi:MAG: TonB-dependent receptor [Aphanocapsa lilacina HA4352-LM1]|nr:TonB-dependent receptor [Aphanocapsa lilacina HA4352-LM1]
MRSFLGFLVLRPVALAALPSLAAFAPTLAMPVADSGPALVRRADLARAEVGARGLLAGELAQAPPAAAPATPGQDLPDDPSELDEVTVVGRYLRKDATTATKTDTPLIDIPQSIQVVPRQLLEDQKIIQFNDALKTVSGVFNANPSFAPFSTFSIRGFNTNNIYRNGFRDGVNSLAGFDVASIERIEVLKGPGSVLYGQGELSSIINYVTKKPLLTPYAAVGFTAGSYDFYRTTLDLSGPLTANGNLAYRLNAAYEDANSFRGTQGRRVYFAPTVVWQASPDTTLTVELEHLRDNRPFDSGLVALGDRVAPIPYNWVFGDPNGLVNQNLTRTTAVLEHRFAENLTLRTGGRYTHFFQIYPTRYVKPGGLLPDNRTLPLFAAQIPSLRESLVFQNDLTPTSGFGVYLQDQISFSDNLKLVLGGRYDTV